MLRAVIIDDVKEAIDTLRADLEDYCPDIKVEGTAEGVVSGAKLIRKCKPDIVFLDIQMQDGSGFDLLEILEEVNFKLIFTTASDAYAVRAFRFSATDYLLKPIDPDDLIAAVKKAQEVKTDDRIALDLLKENMGAKGKIPRIALHTQDKIHIVNIAEIIRCEAQANYTQFFFEGGKKLMVTKTLKEFDQLLSGHDFLRVHQSHLVNPAFIREFIKLHGGTIVTADGSKIPVATRKRSMVLDLFSNL